MIPLPSEYLVTCHTDHVGKESTFVAIRGMKQDGAQYIPLALSRGARKIFVEHGTQLSDDIIQMIHDKQGTLTYVENARQTLAQLSAQAYHFPAHKLKIIAITGTKGKSTTCFLLEHILRSAGYRTALLSTVKNRILGTDFSTQLTTQQPDYLHMFLAECVNHSIDYVIMETAAQAFSLHRLDGIFFDLGIFTNFDQEHAEFYAHLEDYFAAKKSLLSHLKKDAPLLLNNDDSRVSTLACLYKRTILCGISDAAQYQLRILGNTLGGLQIEIASNLQIHPLEIPSLTGTFNAYNVLLACTAALQLGVTTACIKKALKNFEGVPGRLNRYNLPNGARAFIDYAHNPSSFEAVLSTLKHYTRDLIVVFGCGGERDRTKRPQMGAIAEQFADTIILTSDNPRSEDPQAIVHDILQGITQQAHVEIVLDRHKAIERAYAKSTAQSIIVLLGKGPDEYQLISGVKYPFSERTILQAL